jgi:flagellar motor switch/type III secretory pathway protein FliN
MTRAATDIAATPASPPSLAPPGLRVVFARACLPASQVERLGEGSVVEFDQRDGEEVELWLAGRLIGRGRAVLVEGRLAVRVTEGAQTHNEEAQRP